MSMKIKQKYVVRFYFFPLIVGLSLSTLSGLAERIKVDVIPKELVSAMYEQIEAYVENDDSRFFQDFSQPEYVRPRESEDSLLKTNALPKPDDWVDSITVTRVLIQPYESLSPDGVIRLPIGENAYICWFDVLYEGKQNSLQTKMISKNRSVWKIVEGEWKVIEMGY